VGVLVFSPLIILFLWRKSFGGPQVGGAGRWNASGSSRSVNVASDWGALGWHGRGCADRLGSHVGESNSLAKSKTRLTKATHCKETKAFEHYWRTILRRFQDSSKLCVTCRSTTFFTFQIIQTIVKHQEHNNFRGGADGSG
jgi:hypothetical protein